MSNAIYKLIDDVAAAITEYDKSDDHTRHAPGADCIRCRLAEVLPHYVGDRRGPAKRSENALQCPKCHRAYARENASGLRMCACGNLVSANGSAS